MIKCIIFDLGGVVIDFTNEAHYYPYLSKLSGVSMRKIKKMIEGKMWADMDKDYLQQRDFERKVAKALKIEIKDVKWYEMYEKTAKLDNKTLDIIKRLRKKNYVLAYLSNIDRSRYTYTAIELLKSNLCLFDYRFASCEIRLRKPTRMVYNYVLRRMRQKPNESIFIDNTLENVVGARKVGIKGMVFTNAKDLEKQLKKAGVRL
jgi:HAD superfamily hydrolase (TIGR01509 family)